MRIILGIDPGSRITGYGIIRAEAGVLHYLASGCIRITALTLAERLQQIHTALCEIIGKFTPTEAAIEDIFVHHNPRSALKLGQARGVAIVSVAKFGVGITEYSPRQVKLAVVGHGAAQKNQVQHMVRALLSLSHPPQADAADALAVAVCHAHMKEKKLIL